jgi:hypothetical protein
MTAEAKYQSEGKIVFLEISPQTKSCTGVAPQTCMQVREIKYDDKGIKTYADKNWSFTMVKSKVLNIIQTNV